MAKAAKGTRVLPRFSLRALAAPLTHGISIVQAFHSAKTPRGRPAALHVTDDTARQTPHVTCVTRHAQNAKPTCRCRTVAPWSIPLHHGAPRCDGCYHPETDGES